MSTVKKATTLPRFAWGNNTREDLRAFDREIAHACRNNGDLPEHLAERFELVRCPPGSAAGWALNYRGKCDCCGTRATSVWGGPRDFNGCCGPKCHADLLCIYDTRGEQ